MKNTARSFWLKSLAFIICIAATGISSFVILDDIVMDIFVDTGYRLESRFRNSSILYENIDPAYAYLNSIAFDISDGILPDEADYAAMEKCNVEYYLESNGVVMTNNSINDPQYYLENNGISDVFFTHNDGESRSTLYGYSSDDYEYSGDREYSDDYHPASDAIQNRIMIKLTDDFAAGLESQWSYGRAMFMQRIIIVFICMAIALLSYIYLLCVAGRVPVRSAEDEDNVHTLLIDRMWVEINLGLIIISAGVYILGIAWLSDYIMSDSLYSVIYNLFTVAFTVIEASILIVLTMSMIRNAKNRTFLKRSVIAIVVRWAWRICVRILRWAWRTVKRVFSWIVRVIRGTVGIFTKSYSGKRVAAALILYSGIILILGIITGAGGFICLFLALGLGVFAVYYIRKYLMGLGNICEGVRKIREGDIGHKIEDCPDGFLADMADDINELGEGLKNSVAQAVKSERMKAELITNVSHDLKTPLTSIINYTDLLSKEHLSPEEANDYVTIIQQKALRLKNLTADLFDISKAQSGNEEIIMEKLDIKLLLEQSLAELDNEIKKSGLEFIVNIPEYDMEIEADGKKLSRVFDNLINNALKYSMKGTRVYITQEHKNGVYVTEFKNISAYPMNFSDDEITERFVRGDESRTGDGNGLGLAIAKSYTELMHGQLTVKTDGDLFKVRVVF